MSADSDDPLWYRDAVIYELHVKSFFDAYDDGIGDFRGLTQKLDYLQELGVTALWLLPFYPSPLKDDGYDIAHYTDIHPSYGTLGDFREFLTEAHRRGLRVITELVVNHTSDQHPWFQRARRAPRGSSERDFYVWSDDPNRYSEARIIFKDFEPSNWTWDPVAGQYFWHRFFHHQPDLNFDSPLVHGELLKVVDFWFGMGVDGMRLDAVPYLYEREGTSCENLPETHAFLRKLRSHVDRNWKSRMLLAEANQWPEDAALFFGNGDECHMSFHFPIMPRLFMAVRMEDRFPIVDILDQTPAIPAGSQWAIFLRNHDELTLETVTDEERDYMYRAYAHDRTARINLGIRRRLAPLLENGRRKIELMNSLLLSLPGTPVLYYGDEIGMGDNFHLGDRNGVRTPMQWSGDRNAGFSRANPQKLFLPIIIDPEYHYEAINVETQHGNPSSLLWWMRRLLALRGHHQAFGRGDFRWVEHGNKKVLTFTRCYGDETILVVANLSRYAQAVELDLARYQGRVPLELFGRTAFPTVGEGPYRLTLGPHNFFWFRLDPSPPSGGDDARGREASVLPRDLPLIEVEGGWETLLDPRRARRLEQRVIDWLETRSWFLGNEREVRSVTLGAAIALPLPEGQSAQLLVLRVAYVAHDPEHYHLPLMFAGAAEESNLTRLDPGCLLVRVRSDDGEGVVYDATVNPEFGRALFELIAEEGRVGGEPAEIRGSRHVAPGVLERGLAVRQGVADHTNSLFFFGDRYVLRLHRFLNEGTDLDREIGLALAREGFSGAPEVLGALDVGWRPRHVSTLGVLKGFIPHRGDAWGITLEALGHYFERMLAEDLDSDPDSPAPAGRADGTESAVPDRVRETMGDDCLEFIGLLGRETAALHLALARAEGPDLGVEPFTLYYQRSLYQSIRNSIGRTFASLPHATGQVDSEAAERVRMLHERKSEMIARVRWALRRPFDGQRIRTHGDYQLGKLLYTGSDFLVTDFEGDPTRAPSERRLRRSALRDVASMLVSLHHATDRATLAAHELSSPSSADRLDRWARFWLEWASSLFLESYFRAVGSAPFLPRRASDRTLLLDVFLLEKAVHAFGHEVSRPEGTRIAIDVILRLLGTMGPADRSELK